MSPTQPTVGAPAPASTAQRVIAYAQRPGEIHRLGFVEGTLDEQLAAAHRLAEAARVPPPYSVGLAATEATIPDAKAGKLIADCNLVGYVAYRRERPLVRRIRRGAQR